jgi:hypothetical protein
LNWFRNNEVDLVEEPKPGVVTPTPRGGIPLFCRTQEQTKDVDAILTWMRNEKKGTDGPTGEFNKIDQLLPPKKNQSGGYRLDGR